MPRNPYLCLVIALQLGLVALVGTAGLIYLIAGGHAADPVLAAIVVGCIGSLSSLLTSVPREGTGARPADPPK